MSWLQFKVLVSDCLPPFHWSCLALCCKNMLRMDEAKTCHYRDSLVLIWVDQSKELREALKTRVHYVYVCVCACVFRGGCESTIG